uniref:Uncharacterized protein n=1 Tax=viral metagenome TaxID=1070528 RepID=A0A6C0C2Y8_9ZZZZ
MDRLEFKNIYEGEFMISEIIKRRGQCYVHFDYNSIYNGGTNINLSIIVYYPKYKTHIVLHRINGDNMIDALHKMYHRLHSESTIKNYTNKKILL